MKMSIKKLIVVLALGVVSAFAFTGCDAKDFLEEKINQARCEHDFGDVVTVEDSTCTKAGYGEKTCPKCNKVEKVDFEVTKHTIIVVEGVSATCNTTGLTDGTKCKVCEKVITAQAIIPAWGHTVKVVEGVEAGCLTSGLTQGEHCSSCGEVLLAQTDIPAKGHNVVVTEAEEPTCTLPGFTQGASCKTCGEVYQVRESVPATGHSYGSKPNCDICGAPDLGLYEANGFTYYSYDWESYDFSALDTVFVINFDSSSPYVLVSMDEYPLYIGVTFEGELWAGFSSTQPSAEATAVLERLITYQLKADGTGIIFSFNKGTYACHDGPASTPACNLIVDENVTVRIFGYGVGYAAIIE